MSLPKKGSRKIKVKDLDYLWIAKGNGEVINLTISPLENGRKILTSFNYNTEYTESNAFDSPFVITPYVVREVILFAIKNGYKPDEKSAQINLGNLTHRLKLDLSGERKTKQLVKVIEKRINTNNSEIKKIEAVHYTLNETKSFIKYGEWFVGFEIMLSNLDEVNFEVEASELALMKEILKKANVDWRKEWSWIEKMIK